MLAMPTICKSFLTALFTDKEKDMAQYKLISDRLSVGTTGDIVDDKALEGLNVEALIEGGHIEPTAAKPAPKKDQEEK